MPGVELGIDAPRPGFEVAEHVPGRADALDREARPYRVTTKLIQELMDQMTGLLDHAPLETRVACVRDLFERIDVDGVQQRAVACWKAPTDQDVDRLESAAE